MRKQIALIVLLFFPFFILNEKAVAEKGRDSLLRVLATVQDDARKAELNILLAKETILYDYKEALTYAQQASFLAQKLDRPDLLADAYKNIASAFFYIGLYDQALEYFERWADEAGKAGRKIDQLHARTNQALIYSAIGRHDKAIRIFESSKPLLLKAYREENIPIPLETTLTLYLNIAYNYAEQGQRNKAYPILDSALAFKIDTSTELRMIRSKLLQTKARALLYDGRPDDVAGLLEEAENLLIQINDRPLLIMIKGMKGKMLELKGNRTAAISMLTEGLSGASTVGSLMLKRYFTGELSRIYQAAGMADSALRYVKLNESLSKEASDQTASEELLKKELLRTFEDREKELTRLQQQQKIRYLTTIGLILLILFFFVTGYLRYQRKYHRSTLKQLKWQLEAEQKELDRQQLEAKLAQQVKQLEEYEYRLSKNALLQSLVGELQAMVTNQKAEGVKKTNDGSGKIWDEFDLRFLQTHGGFYDRLMRVCPDLTMNERRLCAFLLLDMSTKEISVITGQSTRAIEIARTRLRKKLNLTQTETTLFTFLSSI